MVTRAGSRKKELTVEEEKDSSTVRMQKDVLDGTLEATEVSRDTD